LENIAACIQADPALAQLLASKKSSAREVVECGDTRGITGAKLISTALRDVTFGSTGRAKSVKRERESSGAAD